MKNYYFFYEKQRDGVLKITKGMKNKEAWTRYHEVIADPPSGLDFCGWASEQDGAKLLYLIEEGKKVVVTDNRPKERMK